MSGAAQREEMHEEFQESLTLSPTGTEGAAGLREFAAERLAAHRGRRAEVEARAAEVHAEVQARRDESRRGASQVRAAVAARYQSTPSYEQFLAAEAERALQQAQAEAEVARRNAEAIAAAKSKLLEEIEQRHSAQAAQQQAVTPSLLSMVEAADYPSELRVQMFQDLSTVRAPEPQRPPHKEETFTDELAELEQEIEFRLSPEVGHPLLEPLPIPANIIEFPRQLVASRKARPRLAEGPLREESEAEPQLRIFEVEPEQIAQAPEPELPAAPEWASLHLNAVTHTAPALSADVLDAQIILNLPPETAPLELRLMALAVDLCAMGAAMLVFVAVVAALSGAKLHDLPLPLLGATTAAVLLVFALLYQFLFFTLNEATLGMRYARIALCTFNDANPTRKAMRRRIFALLIALCPVGLGLLWMFLDDDRLGWHDRMSRMYPRAY